MWGPNCCQAFCIPVLQRKGKREIHPKKALAPRRPLSPDGAIASGE